MEKRENGENTFLKPPSFAQRNFRRGVDKKSLERSAAQTALCGTMQRIPGTTENCIVQISPSKDEKLGPKNHQPGLFSSLRQSPIFSKSRRGLKLNLSSNEKHSSTLAGNLSKSIVEEGNFFHEPPNQPGICTSSSNGRKKNLHSKSISPALSGGGVSKWMDKNLTGNPQKDQRENGVSAQDDDEGLAEEGCLKAGVIQAFRSGVFNGQPMVVLECIEEKSGAKIDSSTIAHYLNAQDCCIHTPVTGSLDSLPCFSISIPQKNAVRLSKEKEEHQIIEFSSALINIQNGLSPKMIVPEMRNPVDACLLPNDLLAIADYDNGLLVVNSLGELAEHKKNDSEVNCCGVACFSRPSLKLVLLVFRDGSWVVNFYQNFHLTESIVCPQDPQVDDWAVRRIDVSAKDCLYILASSERKSCIWSLNFSEKSWNLCYVESNKWGSIFNDISVRTFEFSVRGDSNKCENLENQEIEEETWFLLCDRRRAKLKTLSFNGRSQQVHDRSIKMKRVKGQEWIVQGPALAVLDAQMDILVYDGSGKIFLFDGQNYKYKKIVADLGPGEVSSIVAKDGWLYALCRYRQSIEAYLYKECFKSDI